MRGCVFHSVESLPEDKNELKTMETLNDLLTRTEKMKAMGCEELEVGGNTNFLIAARRLGLKAVSLGQIGNDFYGTFMKDVLREERVGFRSYEEKQNSSTSSSAPSTSESRTLVCFVLVDGSGSHAFCSSYDLGPWPLLAEKYKLGADVKAALRKSKAMFVNGFAFDELAPNDVVDAADIIHKHDGTVFFDPGPRVHLSRNRVAQESFDFTHKANGCRFSDRRRVSGFSRTPKSERGVVTKSSHVGV